MKDLTVEEVMTHLVVTLRATDSIHEAATRLARNRISGAPVIEDGRVVGMVSEADLIHAVMPPAPLSRGLSVLDVLSVLTRAKPRARSHATTVGEIMSEIVVQVGPQESVWRAASIMDRRGVKRLPVIDEEDHLIGIISRGDLVKVMGRDDADIRRDVADIVHVLGTENFPDVDVQVADGVVTLSGRADRKSTRDIAVKLARRLPGVTEVRDRLEFEWDDTRAMAVPLVDDPNLVGGYQRASGSPGGRS